MVQIYILCTEFSFMYNFLACDKLQKHLICSFFNENNFYINSSRQEMLMHLKLSTKSELSELICVHPFRLFMLHIRSFWRSLAEQNAFQCIHNWTYFNLVNNGNNRGFRGGVWRLQNWIRMCNYCPSVDGLSLLTK